MIRRAYAAVAVLVGVALSLYVAPNTWRAMSGKPWDGQQEWWCARFWWEGHDPYSREAMARINIGVLGHPPTTSFYALPLAWFDISLMGRLLGCAVIALLFVQLVMMARELRVPSPLASAIGAFGLVFATPFFFSHLLVAQVSELIGFCYFLAWYRLRRDQQVQAGVALGLACTLKLFPAALVLLLALSRRWRGVMAAGVTWLAVAALMTARFGFSAWREYSASEKQVVDWWIGHASNVTLQGLVVRAFHPACVSDTYSDPRATRLATALSLLLLAGLWLLCRRALRRRGWIDLPFALFVVWSMLANIFYWEHYDVILILPLAIVGVALWRARMQGLSRAWVATAIVLLGVAVWATQIPPNNARIALYAARSHHYGHFHAHFLEVSVALPMPILLLVGGSLLRWFTRRDFRGLAPFDAESGRLAAAETTGLTDGDNSAKPAV